MTFIILILKGLLLLKTEIILNNTELCPPPNSFVEALTLSLMIFEDGAFGRFR